MVLLGSPLPSAIAERPRRDLPRWEGHDFAFCFVTDDGRSCNLAWVEVARDLGIRFTIAVNMGVQSSTRLTDSDMRELASDGFEIANHSYSHGNAGLPERCPRPPRGSMAGYFVCEGVDPDAARVAFAREIERDSVAVRAGIATEDVRSFAYPRHRYTIAVIDFELLVAADASLEIYDLRGRRVRSLANRPFSAGRHEVIWDGRDDHGRDLSSGNDMCRLRAGRNLATRRLTLVR
jgi:peptidoglycan/xylan/chitin deacetylase (PgdA/CDA1 family)